MCVCVCVCVCARTLMYIYHVHVFGVMCSVCSVVGVCVCGCGGASGHVCVLQRGIRNNIRLSDGSHTFVTHTQRCTHTSLKQGERKQSFY